MAWPEVWWLGSLHISRRQKGRPRTVSPGLDFRLCPVAWGMVWSSQGPALPYSFSLGYRAMKNRFLVLGLVAVVLVFVIIGLCIWLPYTSRKPDHVYSRAAVATDAKRCSEIGR